MPVKPAIASGNGDQTEQQVTVGAAAEGEARGDPPRRRWAQPGHEAGGQRAGGPGVPRTAGLPARSLESRCPRGHCPRASVPAGEQPGRRRARVTTAVQGQHTQCGPGRQGR